MNNWQLLIMVGAILFGAAVVAPTEKEGLAIIALFTSGASAALALGVSLFG